MRPSNPLRVLASGCFLQVHFARINIHAKVPVRAPALHLFSPEQSITCYL